ncbi:uncharacterized protein SOCE836_061460 [Sorangium cellulosum]|uniref:Uncharacterized protein n=1 Tax=Sorangium cellulosum TaxID=56 RepID=A0A4P2QV01_SORCE|nr:uncharacterized protein SOCE836_061460 [Sorangium cellulosum]WCQ93288.1 hypothetical protein NQZ70_06036 [Sorangium sp. Soce836]
MLNFEHPKKMVRVVTSLVYKAAGGDGDDEGNTPAGLSAAMFVLVLVGAPTQAPTQMETSEPSAGVSLGWIRAEAALRMAAGPHGGNMVHEMCC